MARVDLVGVEPTPLGLKTRLAPTRPGPLALSETYLVHWAATTRSTRSVMNPAPERSMGSGPAPLIL